LPTVVFDKKPRFKTLDLIIMKNYLASEPAAYGLVVTGSTAAVSVVLRMTWLSKDLLPLESIILDEFVLVMSGVTFLIFLGALICQTVYVSRLNNRNTQEVLDSVSTKNEKGLWVYKI
jgi:hypothetical protein